MSFPQTLTEYVAAQLETYTAAYVRSMIPQLIVVGLEQGLSGAEMLRQMRAAGFGIRTQTFYSQLGEVQLALASDARMLAFDPTSVPAAEDFIPWQVQRGTGYLTRMEVLVEDAAGNRSWLPRAIKTPVPVAPGELMQDMSDYFTETPPAEEGGGYEDTFLGIRLTGLYKLVNQPAA